MLDVRQSASRSGCLKSVRCQLSYLDVDIASWFLFREGVGSTRSFAYAVPQQAVRECSTSLI